MYVATTARDNGLAFKGTWLRVGPAENVEPSWHEGLSFRPILSYPVERRLGRIRWIRHRYHTGHSLSAGSDQGQDLVKNDPQPLVGNAAVIFSDRFLIEPDVILEQFSYIVALCGGNEVFGSMPVMFGIRFVTLPRGIAKILGRLKRYPMSTVNSSNRSVSP